MGALMRTAAFLLCAGVVATLHSTPARAAEDYDNCVGTITSLPVDITTQGTWCLKSDLVASADEDWAKIYVETNNVTIDCNNFRIDGTLATSSRGIFSYEHENLTVRNCRIHGFAIGILAKGAGALIEDNRLDGMEYWAMDVDSEGAIVRRNTIIDVDTGIRVAGDVDIVDNVIEAGSNGIDGYDYSQGVMTGNHIRAGAGIGIHFHEYSNWLVSDNQISHGGPDDTVPGGTYGIDCNWDRTMVRDNIFNNWSTAIFECSQRDNVTQ